SDEGLLKTGIAALPAPFRETLVLRDLQGLAYREIAEVTQVPIGTVNVTPRPSAPPADRGHCRGMMNSTPLLCACGRRGGALSGIDRRGSAGPAGLPSSDFMTAPIRKGRMAADTSAPVATGEVRDRVQSVARAGDRPRERKG